jgi:hypothetical protein
MAREALRTALAALSCTTASTDARLLPAGLGSGAILLPRRSAMLPRRSAMLPRRASAVLPRLSPAVLPQPSCGLRSAALHVLLSSVRSPKMLCFLTPASRCPGPSCMLLWRWYRARLPLRLAGSPGSELLLACWLCSSDWRLMASEARRGSSPSSAMALRYTSSAGARVQVLSSPTRLLLRRGVALSAGCAEGRLLYCATASGMV